MNHSYKWRVWMWNTSISGPEIPCLIKLGVFPEEEFVLSLTSKQEKQKPLRTNYQYWEKSEYSLMDNSGWTVQNLGDFIYVIFHLTVFFS